MFSELFLQRSGPCGPTSGHFLICLQRSGPCGPSRATRGLPVHIRAGFRPRSEPWEASRAHWGPIGVLSGLREPSGPALEPREAFAGPSGPSEPTQPHSDPYGAHGELEEPPDGGPGGPREASRAPSGIGACLRFPYGRQSPEEPGGPHSGLARALVVPIGARRCPSVPGGASR